MRFSLPKFWTFISVVGTYLLVIWILAYVGGLGWASFRQGSIDNFQDFFVSLPALALYLVIALAALAGWARGPAMFREMGLRQSFQNQLSKRKLSSSTIQSQMKHSTHTVELDTPLEEAFHDGLIARMPILPVISNNKVSGVVTMSDISKKFDEELKKAPTTPLKNFKISDLNPNPPIGCKPDDDLSKVLEKMISKRKTKIVVLDDNDGLVGTLDLFDIVAEIMCEGA